MKKVLQNLKTYRLQLILGPAFKIVEAIFELIVPLVMAKIIDVGVKNNDVSYILKMGGILVLLSATGLCSTLVCQYFASVAAQGTGTAIRNQLFEHIGKFSRAEIDRFGASSLTTRLTNDVNVLQTAVAMLIRLVIRAPFLVIGAVIMTFTINAKLALVVLISTPLIAATLYIIMSRSVPFFRIIQSKLDRVAQLVSENLSGARVIRAFAKQDDVHDRFEVASDDVADISVRVGKLSALLNPITSVIINFGIVAILWFGGISVNVGDMTAGKIIAFVNYMNQILVAMVVVANLTVTFTKAFACAKRVGEILDTEPSVSDNILKNDMDTLPSCHAIEFSGVSFGYSGSHKKSDSTTAKYVLENVSFDIDRGSVVGIIGGTGSGKTTMINLIARIYDVNEGSVSVLGRNICDYSLAELRKKVVYVPQKCAVISDTIRENLKLGNPDADDDTLWEALRIAQGEEFVRNIPDGLDSKLTEGGKNVSGGQRQRLTIARAIAADPEILILDDSVSALDAATDYRLRSALRKYSSEKGTTVVFVSQRAGTIMHCDKIIVMEDGAVAGIGTHNELYAGCEVYREICVSQNIGEEK